MALIGARGCSKGLKNKNLLILGKKSLIEHTIHDAINSKKFDRIIVSTDDDTIARVSKKAGAEVPFLRPKKFSKDTTIMKEVVSHALSFLKKQESYFPDIVVVMQPTSPFRDKKIIQKFPAYRDNCPDLLSYDASFLKYAQNPKPNIF